MIEARKTGEKLYHCGVEVFEDEGYSAIFRCPNCNYVGTKKDFEVRKNE